MPKQPGCPAEFEQSTIQEVLALIRSASQDATWQKGNATSASNKAGFVRGLNKSTSLTLPLDPRIRNLLALTKDGGNVVSEGEKVASEGGKVASEGGNVVSEGGKVASEGGNVASKGGNFASEGGNVVSERELLLAPRTEGGRVVSGRDMVRQRLMEYQEAMASRSFLGPPVQAPYLEERRDPGGNAPLFSFGVITDIQYADIDNGQSFLGIPRFYRHSLEVVNDAVRSWNAVPDLSFVLQLGDLVDGFCPRDRSMEAFQLVLSELNKSNCGKVHHIIGNHCLYNLPRDKLNEILEIPSAPGGASYYQFSPYPGFRIVVLDAYDISVLGWPPQHPKAVEAERVLERSNPNPDKNSPQGLMGPARRFVKYNGGVGAEQLAWLQGILRECDAKGEVVMVCCHLPVEPTGLPTPTCLLWNYQEVLASIQASSSVVAFLCGHMHFGAYSVDSKGIHHRVLEAVLECPPGSTAFGRVDVYPDRMCLVGNGRLLSTEFKYRKSTMSAELTASL